MTSAQRREKITEFLKKSLLPISASMLAKELQVSRQVIVGDIALLRASGIDILATPRGYIFTPNELSGGSLLFTIACNHGTEQTAEELYIIVDNGGKIIDVTVEHPIYGQITGQLNIFSRYDVDEFIKNTKQQNAPLLSKLTDGVHLHTVSCKNEEIFKRIVADLEQAGILLDKS